MINTLSFTPLSLNDLVELTLVSTIVGFSVGYVADAVMGERGFGMFGNGVLAIIGSIVSIYLARFVAFEWSSEQVMFSAGVSLTGSIALLLLLGYVKNHVFE